MMCPIRSAPGAVAKRVIDLVGSVGAIIVLAPLLGVLAALVRRDSHGPAFFRQERIGRGFQPFQIIKLRTMVDDSDRRGCLLTVEGDPRITRVGRWLRRLKLDELPQLVNVAKGDMSLVGPRPEIRKYVELRRRDYEAILAVRPGLTDPASLIYRDEAALLGQADDAEEAYVTGILPDKIRLAKDYVARASVAFDLRMIVRTLRAVCDRRPAGVPIRSVAGRYRQSAGAIMGRAYLSVAERRRGTSPPRFGARVDEATILSWDAREARR